MPVIVRLKLPVTDPVCARTVSVVVPEPVSEVGLTVAMIFGPGEPVTVKFTVPMKPSEGERVMVDWALAPPLVIVKLPGDAESEKSPGEFTIRLTVSLRVRVPSVALIVIGRVAGKLAEAKPVVLTVRVDDPRPEIEPGLKVAVTPVGRLTAERFTAPLYPAEGTSCTV